MQSPSAARLLLRRSARPTNSLRARLQGTLLLLVAFAVAWRLGADPGDVTVPRGDEEAPPWKPPPPPAATRAARTTTKMRFDVGEGARQFNAREHVANSMDITDAEEPDPWKRQQQDVWRLIILFQHNFPILQQAVEGFERGSNIMVPNMIIVDNSHTHEAASNSWLTSRVKEVVTTPEQLNFPQLHNFMASLALERELQFYFWAHADNYVLPMEEGRDLGKDVIDCLREQVARFPSWGMVLFAYDHLAAFRTQTMVQVPWDPHVFQYGSECDAYGRIRDAGYDAKACKVHYSYDMKRVLGFRDSDPYDRVKEALEREKQDRSGRNQWREGAMSEKEQAWRKRMKEASKAYLAEKWGEVKCKLRGVPCKKPWPYCPTCPANFPECYKQTATFDDLRETHRRVHEAFKNDPHPPEPLEA